MDKLTLFDINGTLVRDTKDISEYVSESIRNIYGTLVEVKLSKYPGMTSQEIAEAVLRENGMPQEEIDRKLQRYTEDLFYTYYNVAGHDRKIVVDGASELLEELSRRGVLIGIATGEVERVARFRIENTGLEKYFSFGAFGNEAKDSKGILELALHKAKNDYSFSSVAALVSGSTGLVNAARSMGIRTAYCGEEAAGADGADTKVSSLKERGKILGLLP